MIIKVEYSWGGGNDMVAAVSRFNRSGNTAGIIVTRSRMDEEGGGKEGNLEVGYLRKRAWNDRIRSGIDKGEDFYEFATILTKCLTKAMIDRLNFIN